ncbi:cyclase [Massilia sp. KIM]|uniref:cyclase family protein n=1 Tax=Massilia sp. KIM TaxID=1955422 RepID=UPI00098F53CB|nr:cyclase family protein [Massilia sp. KIM]OON60456.1 cyclase [Massilia sp. KIM]
MNTAHKLVAGLLAGVALAAQAAAPVVGVSPWGPNDEIGRLNMMTPESRAAVLARVDARRIYDLGTDYFIGMPSWQGAGDPHYQIWMTHTPHGTVVDDPMKVGKAMNEHVSYSGAAVSMYTHMGTHIDALNHFGLGGKIWNGFDAREHLGDRGWRKAGVEKLPPIVARGVLIDVARARGLDALPPGYRVRKKDLMDALAAQKVALRKGDVVLVRTGRMQMFEKARDYMDNPPGLAMDGARYLMEAGAMSVGADNLSLETFPSEVEGDYIPVHTYLLAQQGATIIELVNLEELARDRVYEFAFISAPLKFRGADASPIRPIAIPLSK